MRRLWLLYALMVVSVLAPMVYLVATYRPHDPPPGWTAEEARLGQMAGFALWLLGSFVLLRGEFRRLRRLQRALRGDTCYRCDQAWGDLRFCPRCGTWRLTAEEIAEGLARLRQQQRGAGSR